MITLTFATKFHKKNIANGIQISIKVRPEAVYALESLKSGLE